ncbi:MAG: type II secretion system F family protein [Parvibaculum sp.]|nr:type II secretion system F family protein [Parvibaculum sp.]
MTIFLALLCLGAGVASFIRLWRMHRTSHVGVRLGRLLGATAVSDGHATIFAGWPDTKRFVPAVVRNRLYRAGIELTPNLLMTSLIVVPGFWLVLAVVSGVAAATVVVVSALLVTAAIVDYRARQRMNALSDAMLGYFDRVRQLLVVGNSLSVALAGATRSSPPIVVEFFSPAIRRIANGAGVAESVGQMADELDLHELRLFSTAIETNLRFGGSLTSILSNLIDNIRRRAAVVREMRVSTSQIRASAWVLALLPMVVASIVMVQSPEYARWFIDEPVGRQLLAYCAISQMLGAVVMRSVVRTSY